jgi:predicted GNAT superfamily acetyltransferase
MALQFLNATHKDLDQIWLIIQDAIARRKADGSNQWQDGYPNPEVLENDINRGYGFVLKNEDEIIGYVALLINNEPQYDKIDGKWLSDGDFVVFHRIAISSSRLGKGYAKEFFTHIHDYARSMGINSVKADTNYDNDAMLTLFRKMGYSFCGDVQINGSPRRAYEIILD